MVLKDFFSRYIKILTASEYKNEILELRVEGHTSEYILKTCNFHKIELMKFCLIVIV
ncbi:hypothetical protein MNB_SM-4-212 [hydrothermal vent metagenome]|uniref:Uncharacterized protein n=1 Tax=hydrothermal vent metagenome TaxID=652676 RepID=A0A1W1CNI7_9ZZZZ